MEDWRQQRKMQTITRTKRRLTPGPQSKTPTLNYNRPQTKTTNCEKRAKGQKTLAKFYPILKHADYWEKECFWEEDA